MTTSVQSSLTSDIQLALQHAVVEANNAFTHSSIDDPSPKKKKKRRREDVGDATAEDGDDRVKEKKRKRKKRDAEQPLVGPPIVQSVAVEGTPLSKKKSRKDKGKQITQQPGTVDFQNQDTIPQMDPQLVLPSNASSQASTAAFLSAIVAAAASTPELDPSQIHSQYHPHIVPQHQYLPYPPMQYDYNADPHFLQQPQQPPTLFPTPMNLPFSELAFGSNDDVLRALQDLDLSKIANVLKTLGEAAAAANVPFGQPSFIPPSAIHQAQAPTPLGQVPTASNTILGLPQKQTNVPEHRGTIDMNLPSPEHHTSPDHAHLLANKWLNANKLAELVRTEGT